MKNPYDLPTYRTKKGKQKQRKIRLLGLLIVTLAVAALLFLYFQRNVTRVLVSISEATMRASTTVAVNDAVYYTLSDELRYEDLVNVERDESGKVVSVSGERKIKRRLYDMGITNGAEIYLRKKAPLGDPIEVTVRSYELSLRNSEAACITMEMNKNV